jgi:hypothetical protein
VWPLPLRAIAGAAVGWLVVDVSSSDPAQRWARPAAAVLLAAVAAGSVGMVRRWPRHALATGSCLAAFLGIYACVPETQRVGAIAVVVAIFFVGELTGQLRGSWPVVVAAAALALWVTYDGGVYRDSALVGGIASLGLVVLEPVAVRLPGPARGLPSALTAPALLALQAVYAVAVGRNAGLRADAASAVAVAVVMAAGLTLAARLIIGRRT